MKCPKCGWLTRVLLTYQNADNTVRRRRECKNHECGHRYTTREKKDDRNAKDTK